MRQRPSDWYNWSYDQQQAWQRQERERDDEEYRRREAEDALEREQRERRRQKEEYRNELESERDYRNGIIEECRVANDRWQRALRFIESKGLTAEYNAWGEDVLAMDDED
jgi:hypothetical protein